MGYKQNLGGELCQGGLCVCAVEWAIWMDQVCVYVCLCVCVQELGLCGSVCFGWTAIFDKPLSGYQGFVVAVWDQ